MRFQRGDGLRRVRIVSCNEKIYFEISSSHLERRCVLPWIKARHFQKMKTAIAQDLEKTFIFRDRDRYPLRRADIDIGSQIIFRRSNAETIEQSAISVSPDKHAAMFKDAGVVNRCDREGRRVIGSCKSSFA